MPLREALFQMKSHHALHDHPQLPQTHCHLHRYLKNRISPVINVTLLQCRKTKFNNYFQPSTLSILFIASSRINEKAVVESYLKFFQFLKNFKYLTKIAVADWKCKTELTEVKVLKRENDTVRRVSKNGQQIPSLVFPQKHSILITHLARSKLVQRNDKYAYRMEPVQTRWNLEGVFNSRRSGDWTTKKMWTILFSIRLRHK